MAIVESLILIMVEALMSIRLSIPDIVVNIWLMDADVRIAPRCSDIPAAWSIELGRHSTLPCPLAKMLSTQFGNAPVLKYRDQTASDSSCVQ